MRLEAPEDAPGSTVTVLVWPKWAEGNLNLPLEAGKTYELSAWVKLRGRLTPPELRINVPPASVASSRTGREDTADGWSRYWLRVKLAAHAEPSYLGVWLQGPGAAWLADFSLREVTGAVTAASPGSR